MDKLLITIGCLLFYVTSLAQQYPFVYYTPRDGLVNSRVRSIRQDSRGQMYFCTYGGLSVYNGVGFKNYRQQDGLAHELVNDIFEITPDSLLIATNASALNTLVHGKVGNYITSDNFYPVINKFLKSKNGALYFVADEGLFTLIDRKFSRLPIFDQSGTEINYNLNHVTEWEQYLLMIPWNIPQKEKLVVYDMEKRCTVGVLNEKSITCTAVSPRGELWLSTDEGIELLDKDALDQGTIALRPFSSGERIQEWSNAHIYVDHNENTWLHRNHDVLYISASGEQQLLSADQGLKTKNLADLMVDREGNTWMASDGNGVVKMPGNRVRVLGNLVSGTPNTVTAIHQESDTTWIFNDADKSIYRIHNHHLTSYALSTHSPMVTNIYIDGESLYYSTDQNLYRVSNKNQIASYKHPVEVVLDIPDFLSFNKGLMDPNGVLIQTIWSQDKTNYLIVLADGRIQMPHKLNFAIDQFAIYKDKYLWIPTRDNHLRCYSLHPESPLQYLQLEHDYSKEMAGIEPRSIAVDTSGNVWIGTRNKGIFRFHFEDHALQSTLQFTTTDGLTDNFPLHLYCDPQNNIWSGSWTGLDKIFYKDGDFIIENITKSKNLFLGISKIINAESDVIWATTSLGEIIEISLSDSNLSTFPSLFVTHLAVNDQEYDEDENVFAHDMNNLSLSVAAPSFVDEKSIHYSYRLEGSGNNNWSLPSNNANFNFINLSPGSYILNIKAEFPARTYPDQSLKYSFIIRQPYWQTWWFISLMLMCLGILLLLIVRLYYNRKLEKQKILLERKRSIEKERTRIATDMHDDLGAGLSRIKFLSDTIGFRNQQQLPVNEEINSIRDYAHEMIDKMGEIVWALNEKNDSLSDLLSYTRAYVVEYLAENGLQSHIEKLPPISAINVSGEFRRNIYLSVKEALHNIIKHARANTVSMHMEAAATLLISIQDDGIGFDEANIGPFRNGLTNMKKRMAEIGGELQIINDHGTRIILKAPLPS